MWRSTALMAVTNALEVTTMSTVDFVREIRLRQWARRHYVSAELRKSSWHPIVLDEMQLRDLERANEADVNSAEAVLVSGNVVSDVVDFTPPINSMPPVELYVPRVDEVLLAQSSVSTNNVFLNSFYELNAGAKIVPLLPDHQWQLHPGASEIPGPHCRTPVYQAHS
jgi:hypothetical protein